MSHNAEIAPQHAFSDQSNFATRSKAMHEAAFADADLILHNGLKSGYGTYVADRKRVAGAKTDEEHLVHENYVFCEVIPASQETSVGYKNNLCRSHAYNGCS